VSRSDRYFVNGGDLSGLGGLAVRYSAVTMTAQVMRFLIQTVSTMILARLLTPDDYGLAGMVTTRRQISNLFWFNIMASVAIAAMLAATFRLSHFSTSGPS